MSTCLLFIFYFPQLFAYKHTLASLLLFSNNYDTGYLLTSYGWQVWDYTGLGYTRYNARDVGKEYLGYALTKAAVIC